MPIWTPQDEQRKQLRLWLDALPFKGFGGISVGIIVAILLITAYAPWIGGLLLIFAVLGFVAALGLKSRE